MIVKFVTSSCGNVSTSIIPMNTEEMLIIKTITLITTTKALFFLLLTRLYIKLLYFVIIPCLSILSEFLSKYICLNIINDENITAMTHAIAPNLPSILKAYNDKTNINNTDPYFTILLILLVFLSLSEILYFDKNLLDKTGVIDNDTNNDDNKTNIIVNGKCLII